MKPARLLLAVVVTLAGGTGCKKAKTTDPARTDPATACDGAGDGVREFWLKRRANETDPQKQQQATEMSEMAAARLIKHCKDDGWSAEVIECSKSPEKISDECFKLMTPDQQIKLKQEAEAQHSKIPVTEVTKGSGQSAPP